MNKMYPHQSSLYIKSHSLSVTQFMFNRCYLSYMYNVLCIIDPHGDSETNDKSH